MMKRISGREAGQAAGSAAALALTLNPSHTEASLATKQLTSTAQKAQQIRTALKTVYGWTSRQISVKTHNYSMGSRINIRVNDPDIDITVVQAIAEGHEHVDRDGFGEILSGGNRFVFVTYGHDAEQATPRAI